MNNHNYTDILAIDPGMEKSGLCWYDIEAKKIRNLQSEPLWVLFSLLETEKYFNQDKEYEWYCLFVVENSNSKIGKHDKKNFRGKKGAQRAGKNKGISQNIVNYLLYLKEDFVELAPDGYSKIFKNRKVFEADTGYTGKSNEHERAAAAMAIQVAERLRLGIAEIKNGKS